MSWEKRSFFRLLLWALPPLFSLAVLVMGPLRLAPKHLQLPDLDYPLAPELAGGAAIRFTGNAPSLIQGRREATRAELRTLLERGKVSLQAAEDLPSDPLGLSILLRFSSASERDQAAGLLGSQNGGLTVAPTGPAALLVRETADSMTRAALDPTRQWLAHLTLALDGGEDRLDIGRAWDGSVLLRTWMSSAAFPDRVFMVLNRLGLSTLAIHQLHAQQSAFSADWKARCATASCEGVENRERTLSVLRAKAPEGTVLLPSWNEGPERLERRLLPPLLLAEEPILEGKVVDETYLEGCSGDAGTRTVVWLRPGAALLLRQAWPDGTSPALGLQIGNEARALPAGISMTGRMLALPCMLDQDDAADWAYAFGSGLPLPTIASRSVVQTRLEDGRRRLKTGMMSLLGICVCSSLYFLVRYRRRGLAPLTVLGIQFLFTTAMPILWVVLSRSAPGFYLQAWWERFTPSQAAFQLGLGTFEVASAMFFVHSIQQISLLEPLRKAAQLSRRPDQDSTAWMRHSRSVVLVVQAAVLVAILMALWMGQFSSVQPAAVLLLIWVSHVVTLFGYGPRLYRLAWPSTRCLPEIKEADPA